MRTRYYARSERKVYGEYIDGEEFATMEIFRVFNFSIGKVLLELCT
jgi:hypothetical protein